MDADSRTAVPGPGSEGNGLDPAGRILGRIDELAPEIAKRASEAEAARRIPGDIRQKLKSAGVFRVAVPKAKGGLELDFPAISRMVVKLSRIDGSFGWLAAIASGMSVVAPLVLPQFYDELYQRGPDVMFAGANVLAGTAEAVKGGWRVSGRWPLASGCQDADWMAVHCVLIQDGRPLPGPIEGVPATAFVYIPARYVEIEDTWHSLGLKATGSHHIAIQDEVVPKENRLDMASARPCMPGPLYNAPRQLISVLHGAIAVGIAEGALDDIIAAAQSGWQQQRADVATRDSEIFQYEVGQAQAHLRAAQAMLEVQTATSWQHAIAGTLGTEARFAEVIQSGIWLTQESLRVVRSCFALGGGAAIFESASLQRRLRDLETSSQHAETQRRLYQQPGKLLLTHQQ